MSALFDLEKEWKNLPLMKNVQGLGTNNKLPKSEHAQLFDRHFGKECWRNRDVVFVL